jgi:chloramphenicol-sensitive protein RarD
MDREYLHELICFYPDRYQKRKNHSQEGGGEHQKGINNYIRTCMGTGKHYAAAITAFVIWGFFSIPLRALKEYSAGDILYFRILFSLIVLAVVITAFKQADVKNDWIKFKSLERGEKRKVWLLTLAGGALLTVNWLIFIYIVNAINIKTASFAYLVCPVITAVLGYLLISERLSSLQWMAVGLCAASCAMMGLSSWVELGYSFVTALTYALYLISQRRNQGFDRIVVLGVQVSFSFIILSFLSPWLVTSVPQAYDFYAIIITIAALFTVLPLFLNLFALNKISSATIGILMYLNPLFNFTIAFALFHEEVTMMQFFSYMIIVVALFVFNFENFAKLKRISAPQGAD